jgi:type II secretory pathway pseudopilin PulG
LHLLTAADHTSNLAPHNLDSKPESGNMRIDTLRRFGATLLELLIALCIIGILLGLFLPAAWGVYQAAVKLGQ